MERLHQWADSWTAGDNNVREICRIHKIVLVYQNPTESSVRIPVVIRELLGTATSMRFRGRIHSKLIWKAGVLFHVDSSAGDTIEESLNDLMDKITFAVKDGEQLYNPDNDALDAW